MMDHSLTQSNTQSVSRFKALLQKLCGKHIFLKVNDNRSTMISLKNQGDVLYLSVHRMFLKAPYDLLITLASDLQKLPLRFSPPIKRFMEERAQLLNYPNKQPLVVEGSFYHLNEIYQQLKDDFFENLDLDLSIAWYGNNKPSNSKSIRLGQYQETTKCIKVHRLLDQKLVPPYVVAFVIFHEMTHAIYPPYVDHKGRTNIHHSSFSKHEERYPHQKKAKRWIEENIQLFFS